MEFFPEAISDLKKVEKSVALRVLNKLKWISENFSEITPESLTGKLKGLFKLRVGNWRVIYSVDRKKKVIKIYMVAHRSKIYKF
ncbi:MAG: type II toxin-antitoxin system mRNA interferase toxin, RelE/StbE family [Caldiserica bacterium]|nr:MAG: type II toxin-antitoxin system mRNA interferase toxin, RelE/StbE family [Caldisericota bacterium]